MKTIREIGICLLCLIALSVLGVQSSQGARREASAKWTFMVYMDADNNLDAYAPYSLGMMQEIGSTPNVDVIVLWDSLYNPAYMYKVVQGDIEEVKGFALNGEEANMGDPATLEALVDYTWRNSLLSITCWYCGITETTLAESAGMRTLKIILLILK